MIGHTFKFLHFPECVTLERILVGKSLGACKLIHARVGARIHYVVLYVHGLAVLGLYHAHCVVGVFEVGVFASELFFDNPRAGESL